MSDHLAIRKISFNACPYQYINGQNFLTTLFLSFAAYKVTYTLLLNVLEELAVFLLSLFSISIRGNNLKLQVSPVKNLHGGPFVFLLWSLWLDLQTPQYNYIKLIFWSFSKLCRSVLKPPAKCVYSLTEKHEIPVFLYFESAKIHEQK